MTLSLQDAREVSLLQPFPDVPLPMPAAEKNSSWCARVHICWGGRRLSYLGFVSLSGFSHHLPVLLLHLVHLPLMFPLYLLALVSKEAAKLEEGQKEHSLHRLRVPRPGDLKVLHMNCPQ